MTTETGDAGANGDFVRDWQALRADADIQFAPVQVPPPDPPPQWWRDLLEFLGDVMQPIGDFLSAIGGLMGMSGQAVMWLLVAVAVALVAVVLWRMLAPLATQRGEAVEAVPEWVPESAEALALLEDADRLADEGRFDEATHLLLRRSVGQIRAARPGLIEPSSTAREIAALPALPDGARGAFAIIAERVERSLFALRSLSRDDWQAARDAYARFALATPRAL